MRKLLLVVSLVATFVVSQSQVRFGPTAALNLSNIVGDDDFDTKIKAGIHIGFIAQIIIANQFIFQPGLIYSMQGAVDKDDKDNKINLGYINIPLLLKYLSAKGFFAETGPQIGLLILAKSLEGDDSEDIKEFMKKSDFGWLFGLGVQTSSNLGIYARYQVGFSKIFDTGDSKAKNSVISIGFYYLLGSKASR